MDMDFKFEKFKTSGGDDMVNNIMAKKRKKKGGKDTSIIPRDTLFSTSLIGVLPSNIKYQNYFLCMKKLFNLIKVSASVVFRQLTRIFISWKLLALVNLIYFVLL